MSLVCDSSRRLVRHQERSRDLRIIGMPRIAPRANTARCATSGEPLVERPQDASAIEAYRGRSINSRLVERGVLGADGVIRKIASHPR